MSLSVFSLPPTVCLSSILMCPVGLLSVCVCVCLLSVCLSSVWICHCQEVSVRVSNTQLAQVTIWDLDKFETRLEQMRELYLVRSHTHTFC